MSKQPQQEPLFNPREFFSKGEIAEILKVSPRRVRRWWDDGVLGSVTLPGHRDRRSTGAHLNAWLARQADEQDA